MSGRGRGHNTFTDQWPRWRPREQQPPWLTVYLWLYEAASALESARLALEHGPRTAVPTDVTGWSQDIMRRLFRSLDAADALAQALEVLRRAADHVEDSYGPLAEVVGEVEALTVDALGGVERSFFKASDQTIWSRNVDPQVGRIREAQEELRKLAGRLMHQPSGREDDR